MAWIRGYNTVNVVEEEIVSEPVLNSNTYICINIAYKFNTPSYEFVDVHKYLGGEKALVSSTSPSTGLSGQSAITQLTPYISSISKSGSTVTVSLAKQYCISPDATAFKEPETLTFEFNSDFNVSFYFEPKAYEFMYSFRYYYTSGTTYNNPTFQIVEYLFDGTNYASSAAFNNNNLTNVGTIGKTSNLPMYSETDETNMSVYIRSKTYVDLTILKPYRTTVDGDYLEPGSKTITLTTTATTTYYYVKGD